MKYRKLRIAFSVTCGIACVLLVVFWVRSYWRLDRLAAPLDRFSPGSHVAVASVHGLLMVGVQQRMHAPYQDPRVAWRITSSPIEKAEVGHVQNGTHGFKTFYNHHERGQQLPHWFAVMLMATCSALPWLRWRFSLRTLLIATTIFGLILGLIIATTR